MSLLLIRMCQFVVLASFTVMPVHAFAQANIEQSKIDQANENQTTKSKIEAMLEKIANEYGITIETKIVESSVPTRYGKIECKSADEKAIENYVPLFADEFQLYPKELVKNARVKRVVLCTDLAFAKQRRNAIPDWNNDTLYLEVVRGSKNPMYLRRVIHHEFFHMVDYWDDKNVYKDTDWAALNPSDFKYGTGGRNAQDNRATGRLSEQYPGFLTHYSTTGVEEDKAEVFAHMIVQPEYVEKRAKENSVLRAKVARMKELLEDFCPKVDESFWTKVEAKKRD